MGPGLFHAVFISNSNSRWSDLFYLVNIEPNDGKGNKNKVLSFVSAVQFSFMVLKKAICSLLSLFLTDLSFSA